MTRRRNWTAAREKVMAEGRCRVCRQTGNGLEAAHVMGRKYDDPSGHVDPNDVVPLCRPCHTAYDQRRLDLLPYLTLPEQARAVSHVGIARALRRTSI